MMDHLPTADLSDHGPPVRASADAAATVQHVAVLGTGIMGAGIARSLLRAGHQVSVWNRAYERAAPLGESGATVATSVAECAHDASVVITMLFDTAATLEVKPELLESMNPDSVWVQSATSGPDGARDAAHRAPQLLDAPVLARPFHA